jgi:hypothetical protein
MSRFLTDARPSSQCPSNRLAEFYREEFLKHRRCLEAQRDSYSEPAIAEVEAALTQVLGRLDTLCRQQNCDKVMSALLRKFDALTGLSAWSDPKTYH